MTSNTHTYQTILVLSGKGGVGKSTVSVQLAKLLSQQKRDSRPLKVGVLDIDLCGPSLVRMFGLDKGSIHQSSSGWVPVYTDDSKVLGLISIAFLLSDKDAPVIWRGPKKNATIRQFLEDVHWGDIDYLVIDTPPGTSDEHLSCVEILSKHEQSLSALIVSTPQQVAISDVRKEISFCRKLKVPILGVIENMSGYQCTHCGECTNIFSKGGVQNLCQSTNVPFLGRVPIDPQLATLVDQGKLVKTNLSSQQFPALKALETVVEQTIIGKKPS
mmetsp:Transcript_876/g.1215  ORF Transcript_876/g.1215 Transcript_876/m.1215 type:complete len:272 (+) Transcript_876:89-904(+)|eukprot:CAMPEP_0201544418 /NCGR_PEP_ID=MMETSP0173_2-20130828/1024_1 /ASSEMBLY_ACC=CAM_ASM_000268 /TAXON_ID=218659 /ORGANISM="Vexillifera sp., Strain DIVA3 564/2" /LENGTH=271 /DNA_ID=CAMNT_0047952521 /DNA_START=55 /DNA_END=870 /DNA_ORIENTATION=+